MPIICKDCENKTRFRQNVSGRCEYTECQDIDEDGDVIDSWDTEHYDYEEQNWEDLECKECGSSDTEDVSGEEWENWNGPDDEDGETEEEELPNEKQEGESWKDFYSRKKTD